MPPASLSIVGKWLRSGIKVELRNDDVLQYYLPIKKLKWRVRVKPLFEYFLDGDKMFAKYNHPCTLAVLSDGIDHFPDWVDYIKQNKHRFQIEMHGESHFYYYKFTEQEGYESLARAKDKIENTFNVKINNWYVPWGRRRYPEWGQRVCDRLGIKFDTIQNDQNTRQFVFHYWYHVDVDKANKIIEFMQNEQYKTTT